MRSIFLALTVITAYALLRGWPTELHAVLRACFAVLVLVLGMGLWRQRVRPATSVARSVRPARWSDYLAVGLGILAVECLFLFFVTTAPPRAERLALAVEAALLPDRAAARDQAEGYGPGDGGTGPVSGNWLWDGQGKRPLPLRVDARPSNKPEVFFRPADVETAAHLLRRRPYLRAFALERFEEGSWSASAIEPEALSADAAGSINFVQPPERPGPVLRGRVFHPAHPAGQDVFTSLQGAMQTELERLRQIAPGIMRLNPLPEPDEGYEYDIVARTVTYDGLLENGVLDRFEVPIPPPPDLVALPENEAVRQAIIDIAIKTQGPIAARMLSLRRTLQREYEYSLEVVNREERDPLLNFLLHEKRGHCEFFATAGALLCRALDIPARVAYGWTGGRYYNAQNLFMFRAREAHAWTEVYLEKVGWVVFDTTPPSAIDFTIAPPEEIPPLDESGKLDLSSPASSGGRDPWTFVALGAGLALLPLAFLTLRLRRTPTVLSGSATTTLLPETPGYLSRFRRACAHLGSPMPAGRTLRQHLQILASEERAPAFSEDLLEYHYAVTYGGKAPDKARESALNRAIKRWQ